MGPSDKESNQVSFYSAYGAVSLPAQFIPKELSQLFTVFPCSTYGP